MSDSYGRLKVDELLNSDGVTFDMVAATTDEATASEKGYMSATDKAKLDGIEASATADQTGAEIKAAYEGEADTNAFTDADHNKLDGIEAGAEVNTVASVAGQTGAVTLAKADVGLGSVDNTADADKPVSNATQTALDAKADLIGGKLNTSQIPDLAVTEFKGVVADQTAMLAVTGEKGDWVNRSDTGQMFIIIGDDPTDANDWAAVSYPASPVVSVAGKTGAVSLIQDDIGSGAVSASTVTAAGLIERTNVQPQSVGTNGFRVSYGSDVSGGYTYLGTRFNGANQAFAHYNGSATTATIGVDGSALFGTTYKVKLRPFNGANADQLQILDTSNAVTASITGGGSITSAGILTSNRPVSGTPASTWSCFNGQNNGATTSSIKADGSATFAEGNIVFTNSGTGYGGADFTGVVKALNFTGNSTVGAGGIFEGQLNGSQTSIIKADGSITAASGNFQVDGSGIIQTNIKSAGNIQLDSTASFSSPKITLDAASGSITAANEIFGVGITADLTVSGQYAFRGRLNGTDTSYIGADGSITAKGIWADQSGGDGYLNVSQATGGAAAINVLDGSGLEKFVVKGDGTVTASVYNGSLYNANQFYSEYATTGSTNFYGVKTTGSPDNGHFIICTKPNDGGDKFKVAANGSVSSEGAISCLYNGSLNIDMNQSPSGGVLYLRDSSENIKITLEGSNGSITASGNVTAYSDVTLKEDIEVIPNALDKVSQIRGVTYNRKDLEDSPRHAGVIAQELEKVLPEVVSTNEEGIKSVAYGNLVGLLIEAVKELKAEIETLKAERN